MMNSDSIPHPEYPLVAAQANKHLPSAMLVSTSPQSKVDRNGGLHESDGTAIVGSETKVRAKRRLVTHTVQGSGMTSSGSAGPKIKLHFPRSTVRHETLSEDALTPEPADEDADGEDESDQSGGYGNGVGVSVSPEPTVAHSRSSDRHSQLTLESRTVQKEKMRIQTLEQKHLTQHTTMMTMMAWMRMGMLTVTMERMKMILILEFGREARPGE